jgi:hypothetical protein
MLGPGPGDNRDEQSLLNRGIQYMFNSNNHKFRESFRAFTAEQQAYAISQLDPFHDEPYRLTGAPSTQDTASVVLTVNQELVVDAASFGLPTSSGSKWDLHVTSQPISEAVAVYIGRMLTSGKLRGRNTSTEDETFTLYPISAHGVASGEPTYSGSSSGMATPILGLDSTLTEYLSNTAGVPAPRSMRIISQAFEVVDESPEIYRQGSVCVYERPNAPNDVRFAIQAVPNGEASVRDQTYQVNLCTTPPNRIQQATILSSAHTWRAQEGAYVIARRSGENEFKRPGIARTMWVCPNDPVDLVLNNCFIGREAFNNACFPDQNSFTDGTNLDLPYNISGAYFTGLSSEFGTYRIRSKVSYEILPDPADTSLVSQATPTIPEDANLENLIRKILQVQPAGYPQTWNPAGEVWRKILRTIGTVSSSAAPALSAMNPQLGALAGAIGVGSSAASQLGKKKKKPQPSGKKK